MTGIIQSLKKIYRSQGEYKVENLLLENSIPSLNKNFQFHSESSDEERLDSKKVQYLNPLGSKCVAVSKIKTIKAWRIRKCLAM